VCDRCGHTLSQRVDDRADTVERRLTVYLESTVPLVAYYRHDWLLAEVDGNRPEDEVTAALIAAAGDGAGDPAAVRSRAAATGAPGRAASVQQ
jgi:adenylate kinase